jgi:fluoroquinolone transport system permease protein
VNPLRVFRALGAIDRLSIRRDPLLRWIVLLPPAVALAVRWVFPALLARAEAAFGVELEPFLTALAGYVLLVLTPNLAGMVVGFLLLDQRDDDTLTALRVTPVPLGGYLAYRLALPVALSTAVTLALFPLAGLAGPGPLPLLGAALGAAPFAPAFALFLASFAANKVQGFALTKAAGAVLAAPVAAYFLEPAWRWVLAPVPTYWPAMGYWALSRGRADGWLLLAVGFVYQVALVALLLRRFQRVASR